MSSRLTRDEQLMMEAFVASLRGTCQRLRVGAVIAYEARPICSGYNGPPPGKPHCTKEDCNESSPCLNTVHAEANAIKWARAFLGRDPKGATLYVTDMPCLECANLIVDAGISRVVYNRPYRLTKGIEFLELYKVEVSQCLIPQTAINAAFANSRTVQD